MQIGNYRVNQNVRSYPELTELSPEEPGILPKACAGERTYKGRPLSINGQSWEVYLSARPDGTILEVAAQPPSRRRRVRPKNKGSHGAVQRNH
jgi:hypothetical protein